MQKALIYVAPGKEHADEEVAGGHKVEDQEGLIMSARTHARTSGGQWARHASKPYQIANDKTLPRVQHPRSHEEGQTKPRQDLHK